MRAAVWDGFSWSNGVLEQCASGLMKEMHYSITPELYYSNV